MKENKQLDPIENDNYGIHFVFSTIPKSVEFDFEDSIEKTYFSNYKKIVDPDNKFPYLYKPLKFYMLGDYDVCYVTIINNFKFSHRLFEHREKSDKYNSNSFQSYSGLVLNNDNINQVFIDNDNVKDKFFVGIINLKLNNGLYIGNGSDYIDLIFKFLEKILEGTPYILSQTFAWFELSLLIFIDNPNELTQTLLKLRNTTISDIKLLYKDLVDEADIVASRSLFASTGAKPAPLLTSLFSDTHSHFGFNERLINGHFNKIEEDSILRKFLDCATNIRLKTEVEWQVKPGFFPDLTSFLSNHEYLKKYFVDNENLKNVNIKMVLGKCDYLTQEIDDSILSNFHLIRALKREGKECFKYARKVRTYIYLETDLKDINFKTRQFGEVRYEPNNWDELLNKLSISTATSLNVDSQLKAIKISRQLRIKIQKVFSNFNNGILDPIQFFYFLDFKVFINNLIELIEYEYQQSRTISIPLSDMEMKLNEHIKIFEEGYAVRFLNGYQFESISDFDLDFNNSIQQLISAYGTFIHAFGSLFLKEKYYPVIQISDVNTKSNYYLINYYVHHLTSPEFVIATITKEIFNHISLDSREISESLMLFKDTIPELRKYVNDSYFDDLLKNGLFDIDYYVIDVIRYALTFNKNFELFEYWFWAYTLQNPIHYNSNGNINEIRLKSELLRLIFLIRSQKISYTLSCPTPEIKTYWIRHESRLNEIVTKVIDFFKFNNPMYNHLEKINSEIQLLIKNITYNSNYDKYITDSEQSHNGIFNILIEHYKQNLTSEKAILLQRRNWLDGTSLKMYDSQYDEVGFAIDQTGGVFFGNIRKMQDYFNLNSKYLKQLLDISAKEKKEFILDLLKATHEK